MHTSRWFPRLGLVAALTILMLSFAFLLAGTRSGASLPNKPTDAARVQVGQISNGSTVR